jgi:hypothetical protein
MRDHFSGPANVLTLRLAAGSYEKWKSARPQFENPNPIT